MRYVSLFSGIEAATVAWEPLGWEPMAFCEIEPFPCAVLEERFHEVPNLGDVSKVDWGGFVETNGRPDVLVGGSPCQSFSVAGKREGLEGASGLMWEYVRAVAECRPRWVVWENVPGALSSTHGEDFRCLLDSLDELGYRVAWRVLDAQFFGVAQRRRRVFLVGDLGAAGGGAVEVLFEPESLCGDHRSSREKRKALAAAAGIGAACAGGALNPSDPQSKRVYDPAGPSPTLNSGTGEGMNIQPSVLCAAFSAGNSSGSGSIGYQEELSPTLRGGTSGTNMAPTVLEIQESAIDRAPENGPAGPGVCYPDDNGAYSLTARDRHAVYQIAGNVIGREEKNGGHQLGVADPDEHGAFTLNTADRHAVAFAQNTRDEVRMVNGDGSIAGALAAQPGAKQQTYLDFKFSAGAKAGSAAVNEDVSPTLTADWHSPAVCMSDATSNAAIDLDMSGTITAHAGKQQPMVSDGYVVRRLTPLECERLQGFPDDWTRIPYRGKPADECPDGPRYKAIGNSMAVPVMRWIGERIEVVDLRR